MNELITGKVIGQDKAVAKVVKAIQRNRAGLKDPNKPIGSFIFLGPTGVGKTQLAKILARHLFDNDDAIAYNSVSKVFTGSLQGNAATATKLAGTVQINSVAFDGSSSITIIDSAAVAKSGSSMTGPLILAGAPVVPGQAATKAYVDEQIQRKTLYLSLDVKGLSIQGSTGSSVVSLLNALIPPWTLVNGVRAHIASTIQDVSSTVSAPRGSFISVSFVTSVAVTTTVNNPTRNSLLIYEINGNTWQYVSG
jgi:DNA polymerase III delta prime subunit